MTKRKENKPRNTMISKIYQVSSSDDQVRESFSNVFEFRF